MYIYRLVLKMSEIKIINVTGDNKLYVNESYLIGIEGKDKTFRFCKIVLSAV